MHHVVCLFTPTFRCAALIRSQQAALYKFVFSLIGWLVDGQLTDTRATVGGRQHESCDVTPAAGRRSAVTHLLTSTVPSIITVDSHRRRYNRRKAHLKQRPIHYVRPLLGSENIIIIITLY